MDVSWARKVQNEDEENVVKKIHIVHSLKFDFQCADPGLPKCVKRVETSEKQVMRDTKLIATKQIRKVRSAYG